MKFSWGIGIAIAYSLFALSMVLFAVKVSNQKNDLVSDDYYARAVNYQERIDAENNAASGASNLEIDYSERVLTITGSGNLKGEISFYKPDRASDDFKINFALNEKGSQSIALKKLSHGLWKVNLSWEEDGKKYYIVRRLSAE